MDRTVETMDRVIDPQADQNQPGTVETPEPKTQQPNEDLKELRRTLKEQRSALKEANESAKFWMEKARSGAPAPKVEPEEPTLSVDLVEAISNNDPKAVKKALAELGVSFRGDVDRVVNTRLSAKDRDEKLLEDYPDLADEDSAFFKLTGKIYNDLAAKDPSLKKSGMLTEIAAELAEKRLGKDEVKPRKGKPADDEDEDDDEDEESDRVARVRRQSGSTGRRRTADPANDELDATQKSIVARLRAAGANITEEGYKKRALSGVRVSGMPTRRAR